jgi:hypothetical protein
MKIFSPILKGTTTVAQGTTNLSGSFTGSLLGTAATASYADNFTVGGTLTAQTINVQVITSSIEFNTGSTRNGALSTNTHQFTGSVLMSGNLGIGTSSPTKLITTNQTGSTGYLYSGQLNGTEIAYWYYNANEIQFSSVSGSRALSFLTNDTERMRITSSGSVGINTTSPSAQLHIYGKAGNTFTDGLKITRSEQANQYLVLNYEGGIINLVAVDSQFQGPQFRFMTSTDGSNASERVRFAKDGNVLINKTTASGYPLEVEVFSDGNLAYFTRQGANTKMFMGGTTAGATAFYIQSNTTNGVYLTAGGTSWTANSDIRLKNVISPIDSAVDKLTTLNPVIFSWKSDDTNKENIGLIAQDVKEVLPQVIDTNEDGFLGVRYVELIPVLVKAIQELKSENDTLKEILQRNNIQ